MTRLARPPLYSDPYRINAQCLSAVRAGACPPVPALPARRDRDMRAPLCVSSS